MKSKDTQEAVRRVLDPRCLSACGLRYLLRHRDRGQRPRVQENASRDAGYVREPVDEVLLDAPPVPLLVEKHYALRGDKLLEGLSTGEPPALL